MYHLLQDLLDFPFVQILFYHVFESIQSRLVTSRVSHSAQVNKRDSLQFHKESNHVKQ